MKFPSGTFLIRNARLYDGSGTPPFAADVAVHDGSVIRVAPAGTVSAGGADVLDAAGDALAPGFIDVHGHSDTDVLDCPEADSKISQGVTTEIAGNCGFSEFAVPVMDFADYAKRVNAVCPAVNIAALAGHNSLRIQTMGYADRAASPEEISRMRAILADALNHGAAGFSSGLWYVPGIHASEEEVASVGSVLNGTGKPYAAHVRDEGDRLEESVAEALRIAKATGGIFQFSHFKTWFPRNWHKLSSVLSQLEKARAEGVSIAADRYPYLFSASGLRMVVPPPFDGLGNDELDELLANSADARARLLEALRSAPVFCPWTDVLLTSSSNPAHAPYLGKPLSRIAEETSSTPEEVCVRLLSEAKHPVCALGLMCRENLERILSLDFVMPGSDAGIQRFSEPGGHPRKFGTMPRFFRMASRFSPPEKVIRRMTSFPAEVFRLSSRGRVAPGFAADFVLFREHELDSGEDYSRRVLPHGIRAVYVNGVFSYSPESGPAGRAGRFLSVSNSNGKVTL